MRFQVVLALVLAILAGVVISYIKRHYKTSLGNKYSLSLLQLVIIMFILGELIHIFNPDRDMAALFLNSSALVVAILGFAAQPVITNIICGLLISFQKPFDIGDRILVEGQVPGVVEDITLRHTVLKLPDGLRVIIPNGELNSKTVTNYSFNLKDRLGVPMQFAVSYDTEVEKAIEIVRDCVAASPYTLSIETNGIYEDSGPVYFLQMADSSLVLSTTIWISRDTVSNKAVTDVNLRVINAFRKYGIEIPYPYFNVVEFEGSKTLPAEEGAEPKPSPSRLRRSETVHMAPGENKVADALEVCRRFAQMQHMDMRTSMQLELLTEESVDLFERLLSHAQRDFWVEGTAKLYRIHLRSPVRLNGAEEYKRLVELSSRGKNDAVKTISARIAEAMLLGSQKFVSKKRGGKESFEWKLSNNEITEEEIGRSIVAKVANDVRINVSPDSVELIVLKAVE